MIEAISPATPGQLSDNTIAHVLAIHRHDVFITFNQGPKFRQVGAYRPSELGSMFPVIRDQLVEDSYYSVNGFRKPWRRGYLVSHLTAVFVDIDFHDDPSPQKTEMAIAAIVVLAAKGSIPHPSIIVRSGRGFWLFWLLRERDSGGAVERSDNTQAAWFRLQHAIRDSLKDHGLPVDCASQDLARLTRLPGSINTKTGAKVTYTVNLDATGKPIAYTLDELSGALHVELKNPVFPDASRRLRIVPDGRPANEASRSGKQLRASTGWRALNDRRLRDFETLVALRGGIREGMRAHGALIFATTLRGFPDYERERRVREFGRMYCDPPLSDADIDFAIKSATRPRAYRFRDRSIGERLAITDAENALLEGDYLGTAMPQSTTRRDRAKERRELISQICARAGSVPALRTIKGRLAAAGLDASPETIRADLVAIGASNPRAVRGAGRLCSLPIGTPKHPAEKTPYMLISGQT